MYDLSFATTEYHLRFFQSNSVHWTVTLWLRAALLLLFSQSATAFGPVNVVFHNFTHPGTLAPTNIVYDKCGPILPRDADTSITISVDNGAFVGELVAFRTPSPCVGTATSWEWVYNGVTYTDNTTGTSLAVMLPAATTVLFFTRRSFKTLHCFFLASLH